MPGPKPAEIRLSLRQKEILEKIIKKTKVPLDEKQRAQIILIANKGLSNAKIAQEVGMRRKTVTKWRTRWAKAQSTLGALENSNIKKIEFERKIRKILSDKPRSGHPSRFTAEQISKIIALACQSPSDDAGVPITHWTHKELAKEAIRRGIVDTISASHVGNMLRNADLKPHLVKYWETPPSTRS